MAYVKKAEMLRTLKNANAKLYRIQKAGYVGDNDYMLASQMVSFVTQNNKERFSLSKKQKVKDLQNQYKVAKIILSNKSLTPKKIESNINKLSKTIVNVAIKQQVQRKEFTRKEFEKIIYNIAEAFNFDSTQKREIIQEMYSLKFMSKVTDYTSSYNKVDMLFKHSVEKKWGMSDEKVSENVFNNIMEILTNA